MDLSDMTMDELAAAERSCTEVMFECLRNGDPVVAIHVLNSRCDVLAEQIRRLTDDQT